MTQKNRIKKNYTKLLKKEELKPQWFLLDAAGKTLGRLASEIANILRGKHRPTYTPHLDSGDGVIIINAEQIHVTGNKEANKVYHRYTGYVGGMREIPYRTMQARKPEFIIQHAVKGMVPRNRLGRAQMKRLRVFAGPKHNMQAQQPTQVNI